MQTLGLLEQLSLARKEHEKNLMQAIEENDDRMRLEIAKAKAADEESIESIKNMYASNAPELQESIRSLAQNSDDFDSTFTKQVATNIELLREKIVKDQQTASETEEILLNSIKEVYNNTQRDIETEKKLRLSSEESMMRLFELASNKLPSRITLPN